ncbi:hypothetical protein KUL25_13720 [Rhodobacteraceae bacterium N5(2021)]|uniref:Uncharacterized protein n=1 Tax=Gymnodinialimonas phycosphaerae TaxID=2841589 RepID=A0A975TS59_9RHOB|nr:hypothetical protein [Gymnodinialimonas phycosphaerae]MBY4893824.1 hypothetical protein [Gymnodinialimonas phycosphaerae]
MSPAVGARNLLENCAKARVGQSLLIAVEPPALGYFDDKVAACVAREARELGLHVRQVDVGFEPDKPTLPPALLAQMEHADIVVFLARLGDQLRFTEMPAGKTLITCFAATLELLGSSFGTGHYDGFKALKTATDRALGRTREMRLTCPNGTDVRGVPAMDGTETSVTRFPLSVFAPIPAHSFSGRVAMAGFLTGTGSRYYTPYHLDLDGPLFARLDAGRLVRFEGAAHEVARAEAHYDHVARRYNLDRTAVHSWHAGIHPGCGFPWNMADHVERWGGTAFGNPRIAHFHTCGAQAPGEISWNVVDPTITLDGVPVWEDGTFHAHRVPGGPEVLARYPDIAAMFARPDRAIGFAAPAFARA